MGRGARWPRPWPTDGRSRRSRSSRAGPRPGGHGRRGGTVTAALVCRPGRAMAAAVGARHGTGSRRRPVEHLGRPRRRRPAQGVPPVAAGAQPRARTRRVPRPRRPRSRPCRRWPDMPRSSARRDGATTIAIAQAFVADGADAYEVVAEALTAWLLAPGAVSVEFATEVAADLGTLDGRAARGPGRARRASPGSSLAPRRPRRPAAVVRRRPRAASTGPSRSTPGESGRLLRDLAPRIAEELTVIDALADDAARSPGSTATTTSARSSSPPTATA